MLALVPYDKVLLAGGLKMNPAPASRPHQPGHRNAATTRWLLWLLGPPSLLVVLAIGMYLLAGGLEPVSKLLVHRVSMPLWTVSLLVLGCLASLVLGAVWARISRHKPPEV